MRGGLCVGALVRVSCFLFFSFFLLCLFIDAFVDALNKRLYKRVCLVCVVCLFVSISFSFLFIF
jgi:hypothetical protein